MKVDLLGANCSPSAAPMDHTVVPFVGLPAASVQANTAPPHSWTSIPKCCLYQAWSATGSLALKKTPPIPVTLFIEPPKLLAKSIPGMVRVRLLLPGGLEARLSNSAPVVRHMGATGH